MQKEAKEKISEIDLSASSAHCGIFSSKLKC